jgi:hypothetical protein
MNIGVKLLEAVAHTEPTEWHQMSANRASTAGLAVMTPWAIEQARLRLSSQDRMLYSLLVQRGRSVFSSNAVYDHWWLTWSPCLDGVPVAVALQSEGASQVSAVLDAIVWGWP